MIERNSNNSDDRLAAGKYDREMSVYCLSEFAFCRRAGLCAYEQDRQYEEEDQRVRLGYLPIFEPEELARRLKELVRQLQWILFGGIGAFCVALAGAWFATGMALWIVPLVVMVATIYGLCDRGYWAYWAEKELEAWRKATAHRPDPDCPHIQELDWRNIVASGLTIRRPRAAYQYASWKLGGRPWRILEEGDLKIPVFRHGPNWRGLQDQHFVRMAAYCYLLEQKEGFRVPYGVVLLSGTFLAVTVPNTARNHERFRQTLLEARQAARDAGEMNKFPPVPADGHFCAGCRLGAPVLVRKRIEYLRHGMPLPVNRSPDQNGEMFHSQCGDRFHAIPPHKLAVRKGIWRAE